MSDVRVAVLQLAARYGERERALQKVRALVAASPADLVVLPEASLTGYVSPRGDFDLSAFAEPIDGPTTAALSSLAKEHRVNLAGPLIERDGDRLFNTFVVFDRSGHRLAHYRKRHPWMPEEWATAGESPHPTFVIEGLTVTIAICFDIHFLLAEAAAVLEASDLLLFPSAWVEERDSRATMLAGIARTHGVAVANANWARGDVVIAGQGCSRVLDARGITLAVAGEGEERIDVCV